MKFDAWCDSPIELKRKGREKVERNRAEASELLISAGDYPFPSPRAGTPLLRRPALIDVPGLSHIRMHFNWDTFSLRAVCFLAFQITGCPFS